MKGDTTEGTKGIKNWWGNNWDKVILVLVSTVISGIIGFFSSVNVTKERIGNVDKEVAVLIERTNNLIGDTNNLTKLIDIEIESSRTNARSVAQIRNRFELLKDRLELGELRVEVIKELTETQRNKTINELKELLIKYGNVDLTPVSTSP